MYVFGIVAWKWILSHSLKWDENVWKKGSSLSCMRHIKSQKRFLSLCDDMPYCCIYFIIIFMFYLFFFLWWTAVPPRTYSQLLFKFCHNILLPLSVQISYSFESSVFLMGYIEIPKKKTQQQQTRSVFLGCNLVDFMPFFFFFCFIP